MNQLFIDYETQSEVDVSDVGAVEYAKHPSTRILCLGYKFDEEPGQVWFPHRGPMPRRLYHLPGSLIFKAHNFGFEDAITKYVLPRHGIKSFKMIKKICTAAKAAACGLPRKLEGVAAALDLPVQKDMEGHRLMKKYMRPRLKWKKWKEAYDQGLAYDFEEPEKYFSDEDEITRIGQYCVTDLEAEYLVDETLPDLPPSEVVLWQINQEQNQRGVKVDVATSKLILNLIDQKTKKLQTELIKITDGEVTTAGQRDRILEWIEEQGESISDLRAGTVAAALKYVKPGPVKRVLEIRQSLSKSSTKKYKALLTRAGADERVRDISLYHGAHTGRDSGSGLQLHNLPRGNVKDTDLAIEVIQSGDLDFIEGMYGDAFNLFSSCVRGVITATPGKELGVADYNAIECRVLNWIAREEWVLELFKKGGDPYVVMAKKIGSDDRQLGKTIELASGYQMGPAKLQATSVAWGVRGGAGLTDEESEKGIKAYRESHPNVVTFWHKTETAAIMAVRNPKSEVITKYKTSWLMKGDFLCCKLPSGRLLRYFRPEVRSEATPWGEFRPKLYHWHVESQTKQWVCSATYGGKLVENIVQATARDIMCNATLKLEQNGFAFLWSIYDEIVSEAEKIDLKKYESILMDLPSWAKGLPILAKGWTGFRYKKA